MDRRVLYHLHAVSRNCGARSFRVRVARMNIFSGFAVGQGESRDGTRAKAGVASSV